MLLVWTKFLVQCLFELSVRSIILDIFTRILLTFVTKIHSLLMFDHNLLHNKMIIVKIIRIVNGLP